MSGRYDLESIFGESLWLKNINQMDKILNPAYIGLPDVMRNFDYISSITKEINDMSLKLQPLQPVLSYLQEVQQQNDFFKHPIDIDNMIEVTRDALNTYNVLDSIHYEINQIFHPFALNDFTKINSLLADYSKPLDAISHFHSVYNSAFGFEGAYSEQYAELYRSISEESKIIFREKKIWDSEQFFVRNKKGEEYPLSQQKDIIGGCQVFSDIEEKDIITFINFLSSNPYMSLEHSVGRKIAEDIKRFKRQLISIVKPQTVFYRSIKINENASPFLSNELFNPPPTSCMKQGRFNFGRTPCLYVADNATTAKYELKDCGNITTGKAMIKNEIQHLDMSDKSNIIFEYCLKENDEEGFAFPRAYIFPSFIANLCVANGISGIKYKSTISDGCCYVFFDLHSDSFDAFETVL